MLRTFCFVLQLGENIFTFQVRIKMLHKKSGRKKSTKKNFMFRWMSRERGREGESREPRELREQRERVD